MREERRNEYGKGFGGEEVSVPSLPVPVLDLDFDSKAIDVKGWWKGG